MTCFTATLVAPHEKILRTERDVLGGRTAYWQQQGDSVAVSTSSSLLANLSLSSDAENGQYMAQMFSGRSCEPGISAFQSVREMLPGRSLEFLRGNMTTARAASGLGRAEISRTDPVGQFREVFTDAVGDTIPGANRKTAIMLSGGLDSGPVAAIAAQMPGSDRSRPIAVSWSLSDFQDADESRWIEAVANFLDIDFEIFEAGNLLPLSSIETEQVTSDFPTYNVFRPLVMGCYRHAHRNGASVILNASGGDMMYPHFYWVLHDQLSRSDFSGAMGTITRMFSGDRAAARAARRNLRYLANRVFRAKRVRHTMVPAWLTSAAAEHLCQHPRVPDKYSSSRHSPYADNLLTAAHGTAHENAFSSRYGLDRRDPFQNPRFVELMLQLPFSYSHREGKEKWIMREAMRGLLPEQIRVKQRTGLLNSFFDAGFSQNKRKVAEFLLTGNRAWESWVRRDFVESALVAEHTAVSDQLVIVRCIGYALWRNVLDEQNANGPR